MSKIWLTRTEPGASRQAAELRAHGYSVWVEPLLEITPLRPLRMQCDGHPVSAPGETSRQRQVRATAPTLVVALSAHAVAEARQQGLLEDAAGAAYVAVGAHTAAALAPEVSTVDVAQPATSEGVLALPALRDLGAGDVVWLWAGVGGRTLLAEHLLRQPGIGVVKFELYQRRERVLKDTARPDINVVVIGSVEGMQAFNRFWTDRSGALSVPLLVPSSRVGAAAQAAGYTCIYTAAGASTDAIVGTLQAMALRPHAVQESLEHD